MIWAKARYNETSQINSFDDLVVLAWDWFTRYSDRSPFENPDPIWLPYFVKRGLIKKVRKTVYEIVKPGTPSPETSDTEPQNAKPDDED